LDVDAVPLLGVSDVGNADVVVLTPEEGDDPAALPISQHVLGRDLSVSLGDDPMLDADSFAAVRIGPSGDVAGSVNAGDARLQVFIHQDAAIEGEARFLGEEKGRPHPDAGDDDVAREDLVVGEGHAPRCDGSRHLAEVELDAVLLVQPAQGIAELRPEHTLEWTLLGGRDVDLDVAGAQ
jgi:hypothetical protein